MRIATLALLGVAGCSRITGIGGVFEVGDDTRDAIVDMPVDAPGYRVHTYIKASNVGANDQFGYEIALSRDGATLAVGAPFEDSSTLGVGNTPNEDAVNSGAVYVYARSGDSWVEQAYIKASNTGAVDHFGSSVALSADGNTLLVGALFEDGGGDGPGAATNEAAIDAGAAYVFVRTGTTWQHQAYLKSSNSDPDDRFGVSVALSGDGNTAVIGATKESSAAVNVGGNDADNSVMSSGAAYVMRRSGSTWTQQSYLKASNSRAYSYFGRVEISQDGKWIVVGSYSENSDATGVNGDPTNLNAPDSGAAYVFSSLTGGAWVPEAYLKASNTGTDDFFGVSVAINETGDLIVVGASQEDSAARGINGNAADNAATDSGAAYSFVRTGTQWSFQAYIKASNPGPGDHFGVFAVMNRDGSNVVLGATGESSAAITVDGNQLDDSAVSSGAAYSFTRTGALWSQEHYLKASNANTNDFFGRPAIATATTTVAVGSHWRTATRVGSTATSRTTMPPAVAQSTCSIRESHRPKRLAVTGEPGEAAPEHAIMNASTAAYSLVIPSAIVGGGNRIVRNRRGLREGEVRVRFDDALAGDVA